MFSMIPWARAKGKEGEGVLAGFPALTNRLQDEFDRMFGRLVRELPEFGSLGRGDWKWGIELEDLDHAIVLKAEAPGFEPSDFDIQIKGDELVLKAVKKFEKEDKGKKHKEVATKEYYERITLPRGVDPEKVEATYVNGVLHLTFAKMPGATARKVTVKT